MSQFSSADMEHPLWVFLSVTIVLFNPTKCNSFQCALCRGSTGWCSHWIQFRDAFCGLTYM